MGRGLAFLGGHQIIISVKRRTREGLTCYGIGPGKIAPQEYLVCCPERLLPKERPSLHLFSGPEAQRTAWLIQVRATHVEVGCAASASRRNPPCASITVKNDLREKTWRLPEKAQSRFPTVFKLSGENDGSGGKEGYRGGTRRRRKRASARYRSEALQRQERTALWCTKLSGFSSPASFLWPHCPPSWA